MLNNLSKRQQLLAGSIIAGTILFSTFFVYFYQAFLTPNVKVEKKEFYLLIPTGATYKTVLDSLKKNKIIQDELSFNFLAKVLGYQDKVLPGRYKVSPEMSNSALLNILKGGKQTPVKLVFNSVRLKEQIVSKVCKNFEADSVEFKKLMNDPKTCEKYGFTTETITCMFLPDSYEIYWNSSAQELLDRFYDEYKRFWTEERLNKAKEIGFTPIEVSILASIVGAETQKTDEKPRIAGVYINRLKSTETGHRLQADPTVIFALKDFSIRRLYEGQLRVDSPYNTYRYKGLPPGPINTPGKTSIDAVLNYEKNKYIFFVAKADFSGYHTFAETYQEHIQNAKLYQQALDMRNIK
jgi:UPF0755 protein